MRELPTTYTLCDFRDTPVEARVRELDVSYAKALGADAGTLSITLTACVGGGLSPLQNDERRAILRDKEAAERRLKTELRLAAISGDKDAVERRLNKGVDVNGKNYKGLTPLDYANNNEKEG